MTQEPGTTGARADAIELLTRDHRAVDQLFRQLEASRADSDAARHTAEEIIKELSIHAAIEEQALYPAFRKAVDGGGQLADHSLKEHQQLKELLASVDGMPVDDPQVIITFDRIKKAIEEHVHEEEEKLFPQLRQAADPQKLMQLGEIMEKAKALAPTHPHPHAPATPPGNLIAGPAAAVIDKIRDAVRSAMT